MPSNQQQIVEKEQLTGKEALMIFLNLVGTILGLLSKIAVSKLSKKTRTDFFLFKLLIISITAFLASSFQPPPKIGRGNMKVVIDAGHGGHDSGCLGKKSKEKDIALGIALKLGKAIEYNYPDVKVIYTRKKDEFVELHERADIANENKADLFICIHCNSACVFDSKKKKEYCNTESHGVESWVMGLHKTEANLEVAKRENAAVLLEKDYTQKYDGFDPSSPEANIIFSLYQNTFLEQSLRMASLVQQEVKNKGRANRGVKQAGFLVLYKTSMPSILIETGFLSNPEEEKFLSSEKGQTEMANAIYKAFKSYHALVSGRPELNQEKASEKEMQKEESVKEEISKQEVADTENKKSEIADNTTVKNGDRSSGESATPAENGVGENQINQSALYKKPTKSESEVYFTVQFLSSPAKLKKTDAKFKGLKDAFEYEENNMLKYMWGKASTLDEAVELQSKVRDAGFKDAFVVAFKGGSKISIKEAKAILAK